MKIVYIVTTENGFFAQGVMPWSSMNIQEIKKNLMKYNFEVRIVTFKFLEDNINTLRNSIIIYTSSQRNEHKNYISDLISFFDEDNILIPNLESLKAHDNKGYQVLFNYKYDLGLIESQYYCDVSEVNADSQVFPCVYKPANGASSIGVEIVKNIEDIKKIVTSNWKIDKDFLKKNVKKYFLKSRYNHKWEEYISFAPSRFVLQKFLPGMDSDFKVLIFGDKYYLLKRYTQKNDFRASGSGIHSRDICFDDAVKILDKAKEIKNKFKSHIYSLDLCIYNDQVHVIEFQFTHVGPITLIDSEYHFSFSDNEWVKHYATANLETEFSTSLIRYLNDSLTCSS
ncbi:hypothetical protein [Moritella dasanensis]|uniref:hypothetical protein n=1 Tax=Moritella dasanensis TaxID=428031 RepID=UPI0002EE342C|nr:hypothetical protein [Moritella dasanensis]